MKVATLYHGDLKWSEKIFQKRFRERGIDTEFYRVMRTCLDDLLDADIVFNRVYTSIGINSPYVIERTLLLLESLEESGINCLNSYDATKADYSKHHSFNLMKKAGVKTPETVKISTINETNNADELIDTYGFPLIVKPDLGGRGISVSKVNNIRELEESLKKLLTLEEQKTYNQGAVVQEFIRPVREYDCRLTVVDSEYASSCSRSLIGRNGGSPWLASVSKGSFKKHYKPTEEEISLAVAASRSIGALLNEVDITFSDEGPVIIENNPTVAYCQDEINRQRLDEIARLIVENILIGKRPIDKYYAQEEFYVDSQIRPY